MTVRSSQTVVIAVLAGLAVLIGAAGMLLLVLPQHDKASKLSGEIATAQAQLTPVTPVVPHAVGPKIAVADLFRLQEAMPDSDQMSSILVELSRIARTAKVTIVSLDPQPRVQLEGYSALPITMVIHGKYEGVTSFMKQLRTAVQTPGRHLRVNGRLFVANQIQLVSNNAGTVQATLNMDAFDYGGTIAPPPTTTTGTSGSTTSTSTTTTTTSH